MARPERDHHLCSDSESLLSATSWVWLLGRPVQVLQVAVGSMFVNENALVPVWLRHFLERGELVVDRLIVGGEWYRVVTLIDRDHVAGMGRHRRCSACLHGELTGL